MNGRNTVESHSNRSRIVVVITALPAVHTGRRLSPTKKVADFFPASCQPNHAVVVCLARARRMGVADLCNACSDWLTIKKSRTTFREMSPKNVADRFPVVMRRHFLQLWTVAYAHS